MTHIRKLIDLPEGTVKQIAKEAIDNNTNFKNYLEKIIVDRFPGEVAKKSATANQRVKRK